MIAPKILFENSMIVVAVKPKGVLSVPSRFEKDDERIVFGRTLEKFLRVSLYPVHRLDFEVGGIIMFAKNTAAQSQLSKAFELKRIQKKYLGISSVPPKFPLEINQKVLLKSKLLKGKRRAYEAPNGKSSLTELELIKINEGRYFYWLWPITGRSHQLRFEMYKRETPLDGDLLYGSTVKMNDHEISLDAMELRFLDAELANDLSCPLVFTLDE